MPELPEVETMRRGIQQVQGTRICGVELPRCRLKPIHVAPRVATFRRRVLGAEIVEVGRVGKRVTLRLDTDETIIFEPRMTGLVLLADPPNQEHLRFRLDLEGGAVSQLWFWDRRGLGLVRLVTSAEYRTLYHPPQLGPDALSVTPAQLQTLFGSSRRPVKVALLDQRCVAGIGNLYASEILHVARIHPERPCNELKRPHWQRIHRALEEVLHEAIRHEGSTLSDGTYRNALNSPGGYQNYHRVYDRAGQVCRTCERGVVQRIVQAQRCTFFCPRCQRMR